MNLDAIIADLSALPPEGRREVALFISFLKTRYRKVASAPMGVDPLEAFRGVWKERTDMRDGMAWVEELRDREWRRRDHD